MSRWHIERLGEEAGVAAIPALAEILVDCVEGGASVGFLAPLTLKRAGEFWRRVMESVMRGERTVLAARSPDGAIQGTVQMIVSPMENQPHRADIAKLLVHRRVRRLGAGEVLMREVERLALAEGRTLLVLDTATPDAERLYRRLGWSCCGTIPGYALNPDGTPCDTTVYWKALP